MRRPRIGVADDAAFDLARDAVVQALEAQGAEVVPISPLADRTLPPELDGLWLCGTATEHHLTELATQSTFREAVVAHVEAGRPVYAACGGLTWLGEGMYDLDGAAHPGCGALPVQVQLLEGVRGGRADVVTRRASCLGAAGTPLTGRTLQRVEMVFEPDLDEVFDGGWLYGKVLATWLFIDVARCPEAVRSFVEACRT